MADQLPCRPDKKVGAMTFHVCDFCGFDLRGEPIPQEAIDRGYYLPTCVTCGEANHTNHALIKRLREVRENSTFQCPRCGNSLKNEI